MSAELIVTTGVRPAAATVQEQLAATERRLAELRHRHLALASAARAVLATLGNRFPAELAPLAAALEAQP